MSYQNEQDFTNERVDPKLWKRLYAYAWRNKRTFLSTIACLLFVALIDSLYPLLANYAVDRFIVPGKSDGVWFYRMDMPDGYKHFSKTKPMKLTATAAWPASSR